MFVKQYSIVGKCYEKVRKETAMMKSKLQKDDAYHYDQTSLDIDDLLKKQGITEATMKRERDRYKDEITWFNDNLKQKVK